MNPHLFRHFAGWNYLKAHPGDYETVRQLLGHKSINTTIVFYTGIEVIAAHERYDELTNCRPARPCGVSTGLVRGWP